MCGVSERLCFEVVKGIMSHEKFRDFRETCPCPATQIRPELMLFCKTETRRPNRNHEQYPTRMKKLRLKISRLLDGVILLPRLECFFKMISFSILLGMKRQLEKLRVM